MHIAYIHYPSTRTQIIIIMPVESIRTSNLLRLWQTNAVSTMAVNWSLSRNKMVTVVRWFLIFSSSRLYLIYCLIIYVRTFLLHYILNPKSFKILLWLCSLRSMISSLSLYIAYWNIWKCILCDLIYHSFSLTPCHGKSKNRCLNIFNALCWD